MNESRIIGAQATQSYCTHPNLAKRTLLIARSLLILVISFLSSTQSFGQTANSDPFPYLPNIEYYDLYEVCGTWSVDCDNSYALFDTWVEHIGSNPTPEIINATKGWMGKLPGTLKLSEISIPGAHDAGAEVPETVGAATQDWDIKEQLEAGIRYFDLRMKDNGNGGWDIYHGNVDLDLTFDQVLVWMNAFLDSNPREALIMSFQPHEAGNNTGNYGSIFNTYSMNNSRIVQPSVAVGIPTLDDSRNKILALNKGGSEYSQILNWDYQDYYEVFDFPGVDCYGDCAGRGPKWATLEGKQRAVLEQIDKAAEASSDTWVVNGLNGAVGLFPASVAAEVNRVAYFRLNDKPSKTKVGLMLLDFPGEGLIYRIIKTNFQYNKRVDVNLQVDCYNGLFTGWGTFDEITVKFYNGTELVGTKTQVPDCDNAFGDSFFNIAEVTGAAPQLMTHIEVSTTGEDAFVMDELYFQRTLIAQSLDSPTDGYDGGKEDEELTQWGTDGGMGFCLSTDPADDTSSTDGCHSSIRFEITSEKAYPASSATALTNRIAVYEAAGTPVYEQAYSFGSNTPPVVDAGGPYTVSEGGAVTLSGASGSDPDGDPITYQWDLDGDGIFDVLGKSPLFTAAGRDGPDTRFVEVRVSDGTLTTTAPAKVTITNVAPTISGPFLNVSLIDEGKSVNVSGTFSDPALGISTETFSGSALWSDGATTSLTVGTGTFSTSRNFPDDHPASGTAADGFAVDITINDDDGGSDTKTSPTITVNNVAPAITTINLSASTIVDGDSVTVSGTFIDPALGVATETFSGSALWSDGATTSLTVGTGTFSTSRNFSVDQPTAAYLVTVDITISDDDGGNNTETSPILTIIVTPQSAINAVNQLHQNGDIDDPEVFESLLKQLGNAMKKQKRMQCGPAGNMYGAFINLVQAQSGESITPLAAGILIQDAEYLIAHCP